MTFAGQGLSIVPPPILRRRGTSSLNIEKLKMWTDLVWVGDSEDSDVPWFTSTWPYCGKPRQKFDGEVELIVIEELDPVIGFKGRTRGNFDKPEVRLAQKVLVKSKGEWIVLHNQITRRDLLSKRPDLCDYFGIDDEYAGLQTIVRLGTERKTVTDKKVTWRDDAFEERTLTFTGDDTLRRVVDVLDDWGVVRSEHWPKLLEKHPRLRKLIPYLMDKCSLDRDGTHASHQEISEGLAPEKPPASTTLGTAKDDSKTIDAIEDQLEGQSLRLFRFLREKKHWTQFETLKQSPCFRNKNCSDAVVKRAIDRAKTKLKDTIYTIEIESRRAKLIDLRSS